MVELVNYMDYAENIYVMLNEVLPIFSATQAALVAEMLISPEWEDIELTTEEKNLILKKLTGFTVATNTDLNCYPRGIDDTICFDLEGEEVP